MRKYKLEPYIKLSHELTNAAYEEKTGRWHIRIRRPSSENKDHLEEIEDEADFLFLGVGLLNRWKWPEIRDLQSFKGTLIHSANWNLGGSSWEEDVKDWGDKQVAVIGLVGLSVKS